jgi:hypothetical protein
MSSKGARGQQKGAKPSRQRRCELCNCMVSGGDTQWQTHTQGELI